MRTGEGGHWEGVAYWAGEEEAEHRAEEGVGEGAEHQHWVAAGKQVGEGLLHEWVKASAELQQAEHFALSTSLV